jgi:hypothetical protein
MVLLYAGVLVGVVWILRRLAAAPLSAAPAPTGTGTGKR